MGDLFRRQEYRQTTYRTSQDKRQVTYSSKVHAGDRVRDKPPTADGSGASQRQGRTQAAYSICPQSIQEARGTSGIPTTQPRKGTTAWG